MIFYIGDDVNPFAALKSRHADKGAHQISHFNQQHGQRQAQMEHQHSDVRKWYHYEHVAENFQLHAEKRISARSQYSHDIDITDHLWRNGNSHGNQGDNQKVIGLPAEVIYGCYRFTECNHQKGHDDV